MQDEDQLTLLISIQITTVSAYIIFSFLFVPVEVDKMLVNFTLKFILIVSLSYNNLELKALIDFILPSATSHPQYAIRICITSASQ